MTRELRSAARFIYRLIVLWLVDVISLLVTAAILPGFRIESVAGNPALVVAVADTGAGIKPEDKDRLFEPYFSTKKAGTGLGLTIVNTIVSDHNGYIRIRDNEPKGTRVVIELPVRK